MRVRLTLRLLAGACAGALIAPPGATAQGTGMEVRLIADDSLRDVALTRLVDGVPVVFYNPALLARVGPALGRFFLAHERGHIAGGHSGSALTEPAFAGSSLRLHQELEADCYAVRSLAERDREAVEAALDFFLTMGQRRFDTLHPTGSQRAAKILACLPAT